MGIVEKLSEDAATNPMSWRLIAHSKALRPKQWIKNGLLFLPAVFAINEAWSPGNLEPVPELLLRLLVLFVAFCAVSSSVYLLNDLMDREVDKRHAVKKDRPIASGTVTVPAAIGLMVMLGLGGLAVMSVISPVLGGMGL